MNALERALNTKFAATAGLVTAFPGNTRAGGGAALHWDMASKGTTSMPYLVAQTIPAPVSTSTYGGVSFSDVRIQFKAIATVSGTNSARAVALTALELFCATFDEFSPTLASGQNIFVRREGEPFALTLPVEETQGRDEAQALVVYQYGTQP